MAKLPPNRIIHFMDARDIVLSDEELNTFKHIPDEILYQAYWIANEKYSQLIKRAEETEIEMIRTHKLLSTIQQTLDSKLRDTIKQFDERDEIVRKARYILSKERLNIA